MASQEVTDLCRVVLRDIYGELAATVVGSLLDHGRLSATQIAKCTNLPLTSVQVTLVAMLQNRFVLYWSDAITLRNRVGADLKQDEENGDVETAVRPPRAFYYANADEIYKVLRTGSNIVLVSNYFTYLDKDEPKSSQTAAEIVKNMLMYGHMRVEDYLAAVPTLDDKARISNIMTELVKKKFLLPLTGQEFYPESDIMGKLLTKQLHQLPKNISETARTTAATIAATQDLVNLKAQKDAKNLGLVIKQTSESANRVRRQGQHQSVSSSTSLTVDTEAILSVNHDKFLVLARNEELVSLVATRIGKVSAAVYRALLQCYEDKLNRCNQPVTAGVEFNVSTTEVIRRFDANNVDWAGSIIVGTAKRVVDSDSEDEIVIKKRAKGSNGAFVIEDEDIVGDIKTNDNSDDDDDDLDTTLNNKKSDSKSQETIIRHLELISDSSLKCLLKVGNRGGGEWFVPFEQLSSTLREITYSDLISRRFGPISTRLLSVIRQMGKVDEKYLSEQTLLPAKDIRAHLTDLHNIGGLDLQELPRSADRAPGRTFFFWFHRPKRAYSLILHDLYKAINRCYSRILAERKANAILLHKLQREDVKGNEDLYLTAQERGQMAKLRATEEKLLTQVARLDGLVRIFKDY